MPLELLREKEPVLLEVKEKGLLLRQREKRPVWEKLVILGKEMLKKMNSSMEKLGEENIIVELRVKRAIKLKDTLILKPSDTERLWELLIEKRGPLLWVKVLMGLRIMLVGQDNWIIIRILLLMIDGTEINFKFLLIKNIFFCQLN